MLLWLLSGVIVGQVCSETVAVFTLTDSGCRGQIGHAPLTWYQGGVGADGPVQIQSILLGWKIPRSYSLQTCRYTRETDLPTTKALQSPPF